MDSSIKLLLAALVVSTLTACGNNTSNSTTTSQEAVTTLNAVNSLPVSSIDAQTPTTTEESTATKMVKIDEVTKALASNAALQIQLIEPTPKDLEPFSSQPVQNSSAPNKAHQIGFNRSTGLVGETKNVANLLNWQVLSNGNSWAAIQIKSTSAKGIRIGIQVQSLPANALLRVYSSLDTEAIQIGAQHVLALIEANIAADGDTPSAHTYWTPLTSGEITTLVIEVPRGTDISKVDISVPNISHAVRTPFEAQVSSSAQQKAYAPSAGTCNIDATCTLPPASNAIALMIFTSATGETSACTGTLMGDSITSNTPYFLTANHCISTQTSASSLQTLWFYRSSACNSTTINPASVSRLGGATLLWNRSFTSPGTSTSYIPTGTDTSFLKLLETPPSGAMFAGWNATPQLVSTSTSYTALHHPQADYLKRSEGKIVSYIIYLASAGYTSLTNTTLPMLGMGWTSGTTEPGSSGGPLFLNGGGSNPQVIGQLFGGAASCTNPAGIDAYGRFDLAYNAGMSDWLTQGIKSVTQLYNATSGMHYYTIGVTDAGNVTNTNPAYSNQGSSFKASTVPAAGLSPVYRFFNTGNGAYFYTISEKERAAVASNIPRMRYDGIVWYASATATAGTVPLYRAFNTITGSHFYTVNSAAQATFIAANPQFKTDGIAYYVQP
jgi:lysyl endopeptidase